VSEGERQREAPGLQSVDEGERKKKPHELLPGLVSAAYQELDPDTKKQLAVPVVDTLVAMRAPGDEADEARIVVAHLEAKTLHGLIDEKGRDAHTEAVQTLLSLGFPHALNVSPEDLARFRSNEGRRQLGGQVLDLGLVRDNAAMATTLGQVGGLALLGYEAIGTRLPPGSLSIAVTAAALGLGGAQWLKKSQPVLDQQTGPLAMMTASALVGLLAASMLGAPALLAPLITIPAILFAFFGQKKAS